MLLACFTGLLVGVGCATIFSLKKSNTYEPVYNSINTGKAVSGFFKPCLRSAPSSLVDTEVRIENEMSLSTAS